MKDHQGRKWELRFSPESKGNPSSLNNKTMKSTAFFPVPSQLDATKRRWMGEFDAQWIFELELLKQEKEVQGTLKIGSKVENEIKTEWFQVLHVYIPNNEQNPYKT